MKDILEEMLVLHTGHKLIFSDDVKKKIKVLMKLLKILGSPFSVYRGYSLLLALSVLVSIFSRNKALKILYR